MQEKRDTRSLEAHNEAVLPLRLIINLPVCVGKGSPLSESSASPVVTQNLTQFVINDVGASPEPHRKRRE